MKRHSFSKLIATFFTVAVALAGSDFSVASIDDGRVRAATDIAQADASPESAAVPQCLSWAPYPNSGSYAYLVNSCNIAIDVQWYDQGYCNTGCLETVDAMKKTVVAAPQGQYIYTVCPFPETAFNAQGGPWKGESQYYCSITGSGGGGGPQLALTLNVYYDQVKHTGGSITVAPGKDVFVSTSFANVTVANRPTGGNVQISVGPWLLSSLAPSCPAPYVGSPPGTNPVCQDSVQMTVPPLEPGTYNLYATYGNLKSSNTVGVMIVESGINLNQHGLTGTWGRSNTPGTRQGFLFNFYPDNVAPGHGTVFAGWYTYDVAGGSGGQRWYALQGDVYSNSASASLGIYTAADGNLNSGSKPANSQVGTATLSFSDCSTGLLVYAFNDGRTGSIPLSRVTHSTATCGASDDMGADAQNYWLSGTWVVPNAVGMGFVIDVSPADRTLLGSWYTYFPAGYSAPSPRQQWFVFQDSNFAPTQTSSSNIDLLKSNGGTFDATVGGGVTTTAVGSASLNFTSCTTATFTYAVSSESVNRNIVNLVRLGPAPAGCKL